MADEKDLEVKEGEVKEGEVKEVEAKEPEVKEGEELEKKEGEEKEGEKTPAPGKEKKYTDEDMKKTRLSYQSETRKEREARLIAETENRVLRELMEKGKLVPESTPAAPAPTAAVAKPVRPIESDFDTREEFSKAMDKYEDEAYEWRSKQRKADEDAARAREAEKTTKTTIQKAVAKNIEDGKKLYEDFEDVVVNNPDMIATPMMTVAITKMANAPDIAYYIGKNPDEGNRLAGIEDPIDLAIEIKEISEKLKVSKKAPPAKPPVSKAPAPPATVSAKSKVSTDKSLEGKSQSERIALIEEAARQKRLKAAR
jgi:hypothetical protein